MRTDVYNIIQKQDAVRDLVVAVDRLVDNWSEADAAVRTSLWRAMTTANMRVAELWDIYPLAAAPDDIEAVSE